MFCEQDHLFIYFHLAHIEYQNDLAFVRVKTNHGQKLLPIESDLLDLIVRALEAVHTFLIDPDSDCAFSALLDSDDPVLVCVNANDVVNMPEHERLLPGDDVFSDQYGSSTVVNIFFLE